MIRFDNVSKKFPGEVMALDNFSLEIKDGEFVFLVGPSGAGKTTVLRLILREFLPDGGNLYIDNYDLKKLSGREVARLRRRIGCVFQDLKLLPDKSLLENVALPLWVAGKSSKEVDLESRQKIDLVGLAHKADFFPSQLSGGELQRAAIARALVGNPKYLLADEPTGNVDEENGWKIIDLLEKINGDGVTVLMATHNPNFVDKLHKRVVRLEKGKIVSDRKGKYYD